MTIFCMRKNNVFFLLLSVFLACFTLEGLMMKQPINFAEKVTDSPVIEHLPDEILIRNVKGFDCREYIGKYKLIKKGINAGFYVHESGQHRFSVHPVHTKKICSPAYRSFIKKYPFASEMESKNCGRGFHRRDDFIFCTEENLLSAKYLGTKFTIHKDRNPDWATVHFQEIYQSCPKIIR